LEFIAQTITTSDPKTMSLIISYDSKFQSLITAMKEAIEDKESNEIVLSVISRYFGADVNELINDNYFCLHFFGALISECLVNEESPNRFAVDERQLKERSPLMRQFVFDYTEYQLSLIVVLCDIKVKLNLPDALFDGLLKSLHSNGVVSADAANHWFRCNLAFEGRLNAICNAIHLLDWTREAREEHFYDSMFEDMANGVTIEDMEQ